MLTAVSLVALVSLLVGVTTTLAMRSYLYNQLDQEVSAALARASHARPGDVPSPPPDDPDDDGDGFRDIRGQGFGKRGLSDLCRILLETTPVVCLFVRPENAAAIALYDTIGMRRTITYRSLIFA